MQQRGVLRSVVAFAVVFVLAFSLVPVLAANETVSGTAATSDTATAATTTTPAGSASADVSALAGATTGTSAGAAAATDVSTNADVKFKRGAGITPDSALYPVEKFFENFRNDGSNREKKFAEIKAMIEAKNYEAARVALARYREYADKLEKNVAPEEREEAQRSAAAIRNALKELEAQIPAEQKKEFVDDIRNKETRIDKAAEVAAKIKELCEALAKLDPLQYEKVCKTKDDAPKWQRELDDKLTDEQRGAAKLFGKVMKQCMSTQGKECACDELKSISTPFAEKCALVAPLAAKCDRGDEDACAIMEDATADMEDLLPPYLQDVFADIEGDIRGEQFDKFMPPECKKAGAKTPKECMRVMFEANAPEECIAAAKEGKIDFASERTMRASCEELMFKENAPEECIKAGLKNHKECGRFMFTQNAPKECIDAGITGEKPNDPRKCEELMRSQRGNEGSNRGPGRGFALGRNCKEIQDIGERFKCYEEAYDSVQAGGFPGQGPGQSFGEGEHFDRDDEGDIGGRGRGGSGQNRGPGGNFPEPCVKAGATTREACEKVMKTENEARFQKTRDYQENFARECRAKGGRWDCGYGWSDASNPCRCFTDEQRREDREEFGPPKDFQRPPEGFKRPPEGFKPGEGQPRPPEGFQQPPPGMTPPTTTQPPSGQSTSGTTAGSAGTSTSTETSTSTSSGSTSGSSSTSSSASGSTSTSSGGSTSSSSGSSSSSTSSSTSTSTSPSSTTTAPATGSFISGNAFLEYYFNR